MFCQRCGNEVPDGSSFCGSCGADLGATTPLAAIRELATQNEADIVRDALKGDYEVLDELGRGGMAIVYHAREIMLDREVALKVLPFSLAFDEEFVERFQREARTSARLEHPHIIPVYRVGKVDNVIFFSMKFLRGNSLSDIIESKGRLNPTEIRKLLIESASALGYAHSNDIVHRDIKPDNIMFKENGHAVVCDFGIAKAASGTKLTGTGMAIGTPYYMSPEQARAQPLDGRSDIYSLGVLAYQCLTGSVPFDGEDSFAIGYKHIMEELAEPELKTGEERALFEVIRKMMAKDPGERFQKAEDLVMILSDGGPTAQAIPIVSQKAKPDPAQTAPAGDKTTPLSALPAIDEVPTGAAPSAPPLVAPQPTPTTPMPRESMELGVEKRKKKNRVPALIGAIVVLVGGGGGAYYFTQVKPADDGTDPAPVAVIDPSGTAAAPDEPAPTQLAVADSAQPDSTPPSDTSGTAEPAEPPPEPAQPTTGTLAVLGLAGNAQLYLNGTRQDASEFELQPGRYNIRVTRPGFDEYNQDVRVVARERVPLTVQMRATPAPVTRQPTDNRPPPREPEPEPEPARPVTQCEQYNPETYNADGSCWDTRPSVAGSVSPFVTVPPTQEMPSGPIQLVIQVLPDSTAGMVIPLGGGEFAILAARYAQDLPYIPATKNGRPVVALLTQLFYPQR